MRIAFILALSAVSWAQGAVFATWNMFDINTGQPIAQEFALGYGNPNTEDVNNLSVGFFAFSQGKFFLQTWDGSMSFKGTGTAFSEPAADACDQVISSLVGTYRYHNAKGRKRWIRNASAVYSQTRCKAGQSWMGGGNLTVFLEAQ